MRGMRGAGLRMTRIKWVRVHDPDPGYFCNLAMNSQTASRREYQRQWRAERQRQGFCQCGEIAEPGYASCTTCKANRKRWSSDRRARNQAQGLCHCGRPQARGRKTCSKHLAGAKAYTHAAKDAGKCRCGKPPARPWESLCIDCKTKTREWSRSRYYRRRDAGLCVWCEDKAAPGRVACLKHLKRHRKQWHDNAKWVNVMRREKRVRL